MSQSPKEQVAPSLSPKRREALERLRNGGIMIADKHFLHYIDGWEVVPQNFYWLVQQRLVRVLDPTRKSNVKGNGHVISDKGLALLKSCSIVSDSSSDTYFIKP